MVEAFPGIIETNAGAREISPVVIEDHPSRGLSWNHRG